jgi:uncharacterized protein (TIGR01777 family)
VATIAISGASGFLGRALADSLAARGDRVLPLTRPGGQKAGIRWDPERGEIDAPALEGVDAVIHLAGENVAGGRWTAAQKRRIEQSRVASTTLLARTLAGLARKPAVLISASAVGYYGARGSEPIDESANPGADFLARVCVEWEASAEPARQAGIRVLHPRFGLVLHPSGGVLARMLPAFRLLAGGKLGGGEQFMSWVALEDALAALRFALARPELAGPVNVTAPEPVSNAEFTRALGDALGRPALLTVPRFALRALFGEMAEVALLSGACAKPARLLAQGFSFQHSTLAPYLKRVLARAPAQANGLS